MKIVSITLMRKGSKRFKNKMMAELLGKSLYRHTVDFALQLGYPYYLAHDYDNLDLPKSVHEIKRDTKYTGDKHMTNEEILTFGIDADYYVFLQATNPIRELIEFHQMITCVVRHDFDCGIMARQIPDRYYYFDHEFGNPRPRAANFNKQFRTDNHVSLGGCDRIRISEETGAGYIFKKSQLYKKHFTITDDLLLYNSEMPSIDIDKKSDFAKARKYFGIKKIF